MPQFSLLDVGLATMLQRYEFLSNYANIFATIFAFIATFFNDEVFHFSTFPLLTFVFSDFSKWKI